MVLPFVRDLFLELEKNGAFRAAQGDVRPGVRLTGLTEPARLVYAALLARHGRRPVIFLTKNNRSAEAAADALRTLYALVAGGGAEPDDVVLLPAHDTLPYEGLSPHPEISERRAIALRKLVRGEAKLLVAPVAAAAMRLEAADFYAELAPTIARGDTLPIEDFVKRLEAIGYQRHEPVEMVGQYSVRGGIVDVFPPESARPFRMELFGDDVESIREFGPDTQRSQGSREQVTVLPLTEFPARPELLLQLADKLDHEFESSYFTPGQPFPGWEFLVPLVSPLTDTLFDLAAGPLVLIEEPEATLAELDHLHAKLAGEFEQAGKFARVRPEQLYLGAGELRARIAASPHIYLEELSVLAPGSPDAAVPEVAVASQPSPRFHGNMPQCAAAVKQLVADGYRLAFFGGTTGDVERLADILNEYGVPFQVGMRSTSAGGDGYLEEKAYIATPITSTVILKGALPHGAVFPEEKLAIFGTQDLFDASEMVARPTATPARRSPSHLSTFLSDLADLKVGDFVVHLEHGIGRYCGLKEIGVQGAAERNGHKNEFMLIEYQDDAKLYVPLERMDLVQKYRSMEGGTPHLDKLGGIGWEKTKTRVKKAMQDMAEELLKLYAARKVARRSEFSPDTHWQREFEDAFEWTETADQSRAIKDIKADMEKNEPMDRLLCGDVGYGKTEVAMRAAFKAVQDSRQVAVLAPTTVLVFQHFETFKQRFKTFPVRIEMLSRFRTAAEQKVVLADLEVGKVDIVIGTHRLLSKDVVFRDLGLLVVDEEQRFGVRHKERIKQMRKNVDVLAMSATPIPRTLHMSLVGLRDMSVIETAPRDRLSIQTVVAPFNETIIRTAIEQELARGGQVYFIHNRVDSIYSIAAMIQKLVPAARVVVAHGQMDERALEKVMMAFVRNEFDVLVATTIIENGLDIPQCNTIIVNRADRHGLSELYQLRGRVGRSNRRAYAYLLVPEDREMSELARKRLSALKEFSDLGAGFKIAALDLELRGAGNLLGGEQHGHVNAIGFDLYCQMLERTVRELKGEQVESETETSLNLGVDIRIPPDYIPEENQRLRMYKRLAGVRSTAEREQLERELIDRYGPPPPPVRNLIAYADLKLQAGRMRVQSIERKQDWLSLKFEGNAAVDPQRLMDLIAARKGAQFTPSGVLRLPIARNAASVLAEARALLEQLNSEQLPAL